MSQIAKSKVAETSNVKTGPDQPDDLISSSFTGKDPQYVGNYRLGKTLGEGSFAKVKLAKHCVTNQKVAIKIIDKSKIPDDYSLKNMYRESRIMKLLDHPNIIKLYEVMETESEIFLVQEYASGGEILDYIVAHGKLKESEAKKFVYQIVDALRYCHSHSIVHRDLKAENLLMDESLNIKITDFGLSNIYQPGGYLKTFCGSPVYCAPEVIRGVEYGGPEIDCWSLGINLFAMVCGRLPFYEEDLRDLHVAILSCKYEIIEDISPQCRDLIKHLLILDRAKRYSLDQVLEHPWLCEAKKNDTRNWTVQEEEELMKPKCEDDLDQEIIAHLCGSNGQFDKDELIKSVLEKKFDTFSGSYYLMLHRKMKEKSAESWNSYLAKRRNTGIRSIQGITSSPSGTPNNSLPRRGSSDFKSFDRDSEYSQGSGQFLPDQERKGRRERSVTTPPQMNELNPAKVRRNFRQSIHADQLMTTGRRNSGIQNSRLEKKRPTSESIPEDAAMLAASLSGEVGKLGTALMATQIGRKPRERSSTIAEAIATTPRSPRRPFSFVESKSPLISSSTSSPDKDDHQKPKIRTVRFAFSLSNTSSLDANVYFELVKKLLDDKGISFKNSGFLCQCECYELSDEKKSKSKSKLSSTVKFEVEICKIPRLQLNGVRFKRVKGDIWRYKRICTSLLKSMENFPTENPI